MYVQAKEFLALCLIQISSRKRCSSVTNKHSDPMYDKRWQRVRLFIATGHQLFRVVG